MQPTMTALTRCPKTANVPSPFRLTSIWKRSIGKGSGDLSLATDKSMISECDDMLLSGQVLKVPLIPGGPKVIPPREGR